MLSLKLEQLRQDLLAAAKSRSPSDAVPGGFEKRVMARLVEQPLHDVWSLWALLLWRAAAPCVGVMLIMGVWSASSPLAGSADAADVDLEDTVLAPLTQQLADTW